MKPSSAAIGVAFLSMCSAILADERTIAVDGVDSTAIIRAIEKSQPGDTVLLPAGTYAIRQTIQPKSQTRLRGAGQDKTVLRFVAQTPSVMLSLAGRQDVEVCHLTLDAANSVNATQGISASNARRLNLHHLTIRNLVKCKTFGPHGILFSGQNPSRKGGVTDSVIADCRIENVAPDAKYGGGIRLAWGSSRNRILRCTIHNTGRGGIFADNGSTDVVIQHNTVTGSHGEGLGIEVWGGCDRAVIEDNRIDHWLSFGGCDSGAARRNVISDESGTYKPWGIEAIGSYLVITDNVVDGGQKVGLSVSSTCKKDYVYWARNTVRGCNQWGAQFQGESTGIAYHYLYRCTFADTLVGSGPVWYPGAEGHGFRTNGNVRHVTFEECRFSRNGRLGLQLSGKGIDALSFVRCAITDNKGTAVAGPAAYTALEWTDCTVSGNRRDTLPAAKPFPHRPPVADFDAPRNAPVGKPVKFTSGAKAAHGQITAVLWDFGHGPPSINMHPAHTYDRPGTFRVTLIVWDTAGRAARAERAITITEPRQRPSTRPSEPRP